MLLDNSPNILHLASMLAAEAAQLFIAWQMGRQSELAKDDLRRKR